MSNFDTLLPVRLSNYIWSLIKFRLLVKSQETTVIKNNSKNIKTEFALYLLPLTESLAFYRATGDAAGRDGASARPTARAAPFMSHRVTPGDWGRDGLPFIAGINLSLSRHKKKLSLN